MQSQENSGKQDSDNSDRLKICIVGAGAIGDVIGSEFTKHPQCIITIVVDTNIEMAQKLAKKLNAVAYPDFNAVINDEELRKKFDAVYIGIPPAGHHDAAISSVKFGKHVLCEKPFSIDKERGKQMLDAVSSSSIVSAVNFPMNYVKGVHEMKRLIDEGYVGDVRRVALKFRFPQWPRAWQNYPKTGWINSRTQGGVMREIGCHFYFAIHKIFGIDCAKRVFCTMDFAKDDVEGKFSEIGALGVIEMKNGVSISLDFMSERPMDEDIRLTVYGDKGTLELVEFQYLFGCQGENTKMEDIDKSEPYDPKVKKLMDSKHVVNAFAKAVLDKQTPEQRDLVSFRMGEQVQIVLDAILRSNGKWIDVEHV